METSELFNKRTSNALSSILIYRRWSLIKSLYDLIMINEASRFSLINSTFKKKNFPSGRLSNNV
jgi:hypothetical protein